MTPTLRDDLAADLRKIERDTSRTAEDIAADLIALGWTKAPQAGEATTGERPTLTERYRAAKHWLVTGPRWRLANTYPAVGDALCNAFMAGALWQHERRPTKPPQVAETVTLETQPAGSHPVTITTSPAQDEWTVGDDR